MITNLELEEVYNKQLRSKLMNLERQRKKVLLLYIFSGLCLILPFATGFFAAIQLQDKNIDKTTASYLALGIFLVFFAFWPIKGWADRMRFKYAAVFKKEVVSQVLQIMNPTWEYTPDGHIGSIEYKSSKLFSHPYDSYLGDDLVKGVMDKTEFRSSELHTRYSVRTTDSDGDSTTEWHSIFKGFFFHADFNKNFKGETYVINGTLESQFDTFRNFPTAAAKGSMVKLEDPEFSKLFSVKSTNQIEARYILTPNIMKALVAVQKKYKQPIKFSFVGKRVYCAISFSKDLFEPRILKSGVSFKEIEKLYNLFLINTTIVEELNLNTRIWTKQ